MPEKYIYLAGDDYLLLFFIKLGRVTHGFTEQESTVACLTTFNHSDR